MLLAFLQLNIENPRKLVFVCITAELSKILCSVVCIPFMCGREITYAEQKSINRCIIVYHMIFKKHIIVIYSVGFAALELGHFKLKAMYQYYLGQLYSVGFAPHLMKAYCYIIV